jgi:hypothetical protein
MAKLNGSVMTSIGHISIQAETYEDYSATVEKIKKEFGLAKNSQSPVFTFNQTGGTNVA